MEKRLIKNYRGLVIEIKLVLSSMTSKIRWDERYMAFFSPWQFVEREFVDSFHLNHKYIRYRTVMHY